MLNQINMKFPDFSETDFLELCKYTVFELVKKSNECLQDNIYDEFLFGCCTPFQEIPLSLGESRGVIRDIFLCRLRLGK